MSDDAFDVANGLEPVCIRIRGCCSSSPPPSPRDFIYCCTSTITSKETPPTPVVRYDSCKGCCCNKTSTETDHDSSSASTNDIMGCPCVSSPSFLPYDIDGLLQGNNTHTYSRPIFECNSLCECSSSSCPQRSSQHGVLIEGLQLFHSVGKGWSLITTSSLPAGSFVCEYAGEILSIHEATRRISYYERRARRVTRSSSMRAANYLLVVREHIAGKRILHTCIDPTYQGNIGRFINHSCTPNLRLECVRIDSIIPRVCLYTNRSIAAGEELCFDYGGGDSALGETSCLCGSVSCRGFLPSTSLD